MTHITILSIAGIVLFSAGFGLGAVWFGMFA